MNSWLYHGGCVEVMRTWPEASVDAVVTDPPYELGFMGKAWDKAGVAFDPATWREVLRLLKPGGHLLAFGGTRTYHRMTCAIEDAGFEIRDSLHWIYGTGFPKSLNLGDGRGTALKPAHEPIVLARRPFEGTVAENVGQHGTGALNIDVCRIATDENPSAKFRASHTPVRESGVWANDRRSAETYKRERPGEALGRWPANVLLDEGAAAELDAQSGARGCEGTHSASTTRAGSTDFSPTQGQLYSDSGGASRFFYVSKPSRKERDQGCAHLPQRTGGEATDREDDSAGVDNPRAGAGRTGGARNYHPTVKPIELMRYLVRLITPPGGVVLDPFVGSGTTGMAALLEGLKFVGIEREHEYLVIAQARINAAHLEAQNVVTSIE